MRTSEGPQVSARIARLDCRELHLRVASGTLRTLVLCVEHGRCLVTDGCRWAGGDRSILPPRTAEHVGQFCSLTQFNELHRPADSQVVHSLTRLNDDVLLKAKDGFPCALCRKIRPKTLRLLCSLHEMPLATALLITAILMYGGGH